jgi:NAD(P)-dependent dehydrogenase (short-subunit alcohol dehydrogenase family)
MAIDFSNKTVIISGAASGIGFAMAQELGQQGMNVVMADIEEKALQTAATKLQEAGVSVLASILDVSIYEQWQATVAAAVAKFGGVHMLINNAGVGGVPGKIEDTNNDTWRWVVDVNLMGVMYGTQAATPAIKASVDPEKGDRGWIINVASMAGMGGVPYSAAYAATKAAVVSMTESWAVELKRNNIHVSVLCPAFVKTRIHESMRTLQDKYKSEPIKGDREKLKKGFNQAAALVESGIPAELLAKRVVEALNNKQTYIFTHPNYREPIAGRSAAIDRAFEDAQNSPLVKHLIDDDIVSL